MLKSLAASRKQYFCYLWLLDRYGISYPCPDSLLVRLLEHILHFDLETSIGTESSWPNPNSYSRFGSYSEHVYRGPLVANPIQMLALVSKLLGTPIFEKWLSPYHSAHVLRSSTEASTIDLRVKEDTPTGQMNSVRPTLILKQDTICKIPKRKQHYLASLLDV